MKFIFGSPCLIIIVFKICSMCRLSWYIDMCKNRSSPECLKTVNIYVKMTQRREMLLKLNAIKTMFIIYLSFYALNHDTFTDILQNIFQSHSILSPVVIQLDQRSVLLHQ